MAMSNQESLTIDLLRGGIIVRLSIHKVTSFQVQDLQLHGEWLVFHKALVTILGEHELAARSLV